MSNLLEIILGFIGISIILGYAIWQDNKISKLEKELERKDNELRHKISSIENR